MPIISASIPEHAYRVLDDYATATERSLSAVVRMALAAWLVKNTTWRPPGQRKKRPLADA